MHPPRNIQLNVYDELFVLSEKNDKENLKDPTKAKEEGDVNGANKAMQNQGKKIQLENIKQLGKFNQKLNDLLYSTKELEENAQRTESLLEHDLVLKVRCGLDSF